MTTLNITVLGTGDMGGAIVTALAERTAHRIVLRGARPGSASAAALAARHGLSEASKADIAASDIVFVVVPAKAIPEIVPVLKDYAGIIVSVSVSGTVARDGQPSSAETIAAALPKARVVNAFTSIWSTVVRNPGSAGKTSAFVCADDEAAKRLVAGLAEELGFEWVDGGKLGTALFAEALGMFAVRLAIDSGYGQTISFRAFNATP